MSETTIQGGALLGMLLALPLISWGAASEVPSAMLAGALPIAVSTLSLTVIRFIELDADQEET